MGFFQSAHIARPINYVGFDGTFTNFNYAVREMLGGEEDRCLVIGFAIFEFLN